MRIKTHEHINQSGTINLNTKIYTKPYIRFNTVGSSEYTEEKIILPNIHINLINKNTAMVVEGETDETGTVYFDSVIAGEYTVEASDPQRIYSTIEKQISINRSSDSEIELVLVNKVLPNASVTVLNEKTNEPVFLANVHLYNEYVEFNEYTNRDGVITYRDFPVGTYSTEVTQDGYEDYEKDYIFDEEHQNHNILLKPIESGLFYIQTNNYYEEHITGAHIVLEGEFGAKYEGTSGSDGLITFDNILFGEYTAEITHDDYFTYTGTINVEKTGSTEIIKLFKKVIKEYKINSVKDSETEALLENIECTFINKETLTETSVFTDNNGQAVVNNFPAGEYSVRFQNDFYETTVEEAIIVDELHNSLDTVLNRSSFSDIKFTTCDIFNSNLLSNKQVQIVDEEHSETIKGITDDEGVFRPEKNIPAGYYIIIVEDKDTIIYDEEEVPFYQTHIIEHQLISNSSQHDFLLQLTPNLIPFVNLTLINEGTGEPVPNHKVRVTNEDLEELELESNNEGIVKVENHCRHGVESTIGIYGFDEAGKDSIIYSTNFIAQLDNNSLNINVPARSIPNYTIIVKDKESGELLTGIRVKYHDDNYDTTNYTDYNGEVHFTNMAIEGKAFTCEINGDYHDTESFVVTPVSSNPRKELLVQRARITFGINIEDSTTHHRIEGATIEFTNSNGDKITGISDEDGICKFIDYESYDSTYTVTKGGYDTTTGALNLNKYCHTEVYTFNMTQNNNCNAKLTFVSQMGSKPTGGTVKLSTEEEEFTEEVNRDGEATFTNVPEGVYELQAEFDDTDAGGKNSYSECIDTLEITEFNTVKEIPVNVNVAKGRIGLKVAGVTVSDYYFTFVNSNIQNMFVESMIPQNIDIPDVRSDVIFSKDGKSHIFEVIPQMDKGTVIMGKID